MSPTIKSNLLCLAATFSISMNVLAEMKSLSDNDLSEVDGAGIGLVMDDFVFSHGHNLAEDKIFRITGIKSKDNEDVTINVNQLYVARSGSNYGATLEGVNLGRLSNPYEINLIDGDDIGLSGEAVLQLAAPSKVDQIDGYDCLDSNAVQGSGTCSSRPSSAEWLNGERPDIGLELELNVGAEAPKNLNFNVQSAVFDGSYLRLWGDENVNKMAAEFRLNFYTPQLEISTCSQSNQGCSSSIKMQDFQLELALGNTFQPLYIGVDNISGGLSFEIAKITHEYLGNIDLVSGQSDGSAQGNEAYAFFEDFYTNDAYRSNFSVGNLDLGGVSLGSSKVEGILIQYLDVKFRDLTP
tara:strand:- start:3759 stop:4817 length:1059 start_codon:yes stop_codon:yes gene_type:complete